jgi:hypothetical protein
MASLTRAGWTASSSVAEKSQQIDAFGRDAFAELVRTDIDLFTSIRSAARRQRQTPCAWRSARPVLH